MKTYVLAELPSDYNVTPLIQFLMDNNLRFKISRSVEELEPWTSKPSDGAAPASRPEGIPQSGSLPASVKVEANLPWNAPNLVVAQAMGSLIGVKPTPAPQVNQWNFSEVTTAPTTAGQLFPDRQNGDFQSVEELMKMDLVRFSSDQNELVQKPSLPSVEQLLGLKRMKQEPVRVNAGHGKLPQMETNLEWIPPRLEDLMAQAMGNVPVLGVEPTPAPQMNQWVFPETVAAPTTTGQLFPGTQYGGFQSVNELMKKDLVKFSSGRKEVVQKRRLPSAEEKGIGLKRVKEEPIRLHAGHEALPQANLFADGLMGPAVFNLWKCGDGSCGKSFRTSIELATHQALHRQEKRALQCAVCWRKFTTQFGLNCHLRAHIQQTVFDCNSCGAKFQNLSQLMEHRLSHISNQCVKCGLFFATLDEQIDHDCGICGKCGHLVTSAEHKCKKRVRRIGTVCILCDERLASDKDLWVHCVQRHPPVPV